ncbi:MAG: cytidine deaminase [Erysipelotrichaceae bacterium]|nr:cytidine deaminase [Erysipelotrichaceae bacterium]
MHIYDSKENHRMITNEELIEKAFEAMKNAYAPYSNYHVGACVLCNDGTTFKGANIENASFGATNCGERSAVFAAYSNGYRRNDIKAIAIVSDGKRIGTPCGICRQVLSELLRHDTPIILSNGAETRITDAGKLLPDSFGVEDLEG